MNGILGIAAEFLDRVGNPAHGVEVNEAYAQRLGQLVRSDRDTLGSLLATTLEPDDLDTLSMDAWMWYLDWRSSTAPLPDDSFLTALYQRAATEPAVRLNILRLVTSAPAVRERFQRELPGPPLPIGEFPVPWLRELMRSAVRGEDLAGQALPEQDPSARVNSALELATYLLQLGDEVSQQTLRSLLAQPWPGQQQLAGLVRGMLAGAGLEDDLLQSWQNRLGILGERG
jgi:hypothetical protein